MEIGKVDFLCIGAARSGTTSLYNVLSKHQEIYVPNTKRPEPHFFLKTAEFEKGYSYYHEKYFSNVKDEKVIGEVSTSYLFSYESATRIKDYNPDIKFIVCLRNPIDRAFSNYWHSVKNNLEKESFEYAVKYETFRFENLSSSMKEIAPFSYLERGNYGGQIEHYFSLFAPKQFHFMLFDNMLSEPENQMRLLFKFLGVNEADSAAYSFTSSNKSVPNSENMDSKLRSYLVEYFLSSNKKTSELIGEDLSHWNK